MSETQQSIVHTPGPWREYAPRIDDQVDREYRTIRGGDGLRGSGFELTGFICEADAKLIAAAPDLLKACQAMIGAVEYAGTRLIGAEYMAHQKMLEAVKRANATEVV